MSSLLWAGGCRLHCVRRTSSAMLRAGRESLPRKHLETEIIESGGQNELVVLSSFGSTSLPPAPHLKNMALFRQYVCGVI